MTENLRDELRDALTPVLAALGNNLTDLDAPNDGGNVAQSDVVYEVYVYSLVIEVLQDMDASPSIVPASSVFRVRRSHGDLGDTPTNYSYVEFTYSGTVYELHLDTYYSVLQGDGKLEVDVSALSKADADAVRSGALDRPVPAYIQLLLEAKHYGHTASTTPAKTYLATCFCLRENDSSEALVLSGKMTKGATDLVTGPGYHVHAEVSPLGVHNDNVRDFKERLKTELVDLLG